MLHFFNPGHEYALLNHSPYYTPPSSMVKMQQELAYIACWYANEGDIVLGFETLTDDFKESIENIHKKVQYISIKEIGDNRELLKNQTISLWGISPQAIHFFEGLNKRYDLNLNIPQWDSGLIELGSRRKAQECLSFLIEKNQEIQEDILPQIHITLNSIEDLVTNTPYKLLAKAPYSSSGRGLLWLPIGELTRTERQILHGILKKQKYVSIEKALNKQLDFAMEFKINVESVDFIGYSLFKTNKKGAYLCNSVDKQEHLKHEIEAYISANSLDKIKADLVDFFRSQYSSVYNGYIGVDMMVYEENGDYFLQPCVEINMRNNMGIVALNFSNKYLNPSSNGRLYIDFSAKGDIYEKHLSDIEKYPLIKDNGKIKSGYLPLCPVKSNNSYRAYIIIIGG